MASAATSVVGGELQGWASLLDKWAEEQTYKDELAQQAQYQQQATGVFNQNLPQFSSGAAVGDMASGAAGRMAGYTAAEAVPTSVTKGNVTDYGQGARTTMDQTTGAPRAALGAYSDWQHQLGTQSDAESRALNQILNFAQGSASTYPYQMYDAQHSWDAMSEVGAAISSLGGGAANFAQFSQAPQMNEFQQGGGMSAANSIQGNQNFYDIPSPSFDGSQAAYVVG